MSQQETQPRDQQEQSQTSATAPQATAQTGIGALQSLVANSVQTAMAPMSSVFRSLDNSLRGIQTSLQRLQSATTEHTPNGTPGFPPAVQGSGPPPTSTPSAGSVASTPAAPIGQSPSTLGEPLHGLTTTSLTNCMPSYSATMRMPNPSSLASIPLIAPHTLSPLAVTQTQPLAGGPAGPSTVAPITCTLGLGVNTNHTVTVGPNAMPIPNKLIQKIKRGEYVDMTELLPEKLGQMEEEQSSSDKKDKKRNKAKISSVAQWGECFNAYITVVNQHQPERMSDLLSYASLILRASRMYQGEGWIQYDRNFRKKAAAFPSLSWGNIDNSLWTMAFCSATPRQHCKLCFSVDHSTEECEEYKPPSQPKVETQSGQAPYASSNDICQKWNWLSCTFASCKYRHVCLECHRQHKIRECPSQKRYTPYPTYRSQQGDRSSFRKGAQK